MTHSCFHRSILVPFAGVMLTLAACATDGTTGGPSPNGTLATTESRQSAAPDRKDRKPQAGGNRKPALNRTPADETAGPPVPAKPPAIGGSGG